MFLGNESVLRRDNQERYPIQPNAPILRSSVQSPGHRSDTAEAIHCLAACGSLGGTGGKELLEMLMRMGGTRAA
jgi:hypothetical protein